MVRRSILLLVVFGCLRCGSSNASDPDSGVEPDAGQAGDAGGDPDAGTNVDGAVRDSGLSGPGLTGVLRSEDEQPLGTTRILACLATTCYYEESDREGRFYFAIDPPADIALKTLGDPTASPRLGATLAPVRLVDQSLVDVGSIFVPTLPPGAPLGPAGQDPQTLPAGDGLELTLRRADLTPRLGDTLVDVAARRIPEAHIPRIPELGESEIVAVYALHPFAAHSASPIEIRAALPLPSGTAVEFRAISEIDGHLFEPVFGTSDGTAVTTAPGTGITELTWLIISISE